MGLFSRKGDKPPIERILDETMPLVIGMRHTSEEFAFAIPEAPGRVRAAIEAYVPTDGALLDPAALGETCALAALMTGTVAAITPTILCIDLAPEGGGTRVTVRVHAKEGLIDQHTCRRAADALRRGIAGEETDS